MKRVVQLLSVLFWASVALAQTTNFVVPNGNANVEGNSSSSGEINSSSFRLQMVFDASQFAIPAGASGRINRISFRLDGASTGPGGASFGGGIVTASLTPVGPDGLSPVFADNVGANPVTIYSGALAMGGTYVPGANPQPFGSGISMTTPFWYIPSQGNLLLDIAGFGGQTVFPGGLDGHFASGDSISRVFALNGNSLIGTADTLGLVTRFDMTVVPEPSTWALALIGCLLIFAFKRR
jgi:hypothetical protein